MPVRLAAATASVPTIVASVTPLVPSVPPEKEALAIFGAAVELPMVATQSLRWAGDAELAVVHGGNDIRPKRSAGAADIVENLGCVADGRLIVSLNVLASCLPPSRPKGRCRPCRYRIAVRTAPVTGEPATSMILAEAATSVPSVTRTARTLLAPICEEIRKSGREIVLSESDAAERIIRREDGAIDWTP